MSYTMVNSPGLTNLLSSTLGSTAGTGGWFRLHPTLGNPTFQVVQTGSSVGATAASTTIIEVSNVPDTGQVPIAARLTIALSGTTDVVSDGGALPSSINGDWGFVRARLLSLTTSTAGSTGSPSVAVWMNCGYKGMM